LQGRRIAIRNKPTTTTKKGVLEFSMPKKEKKKAVNGSTRI
jgi:hypothetical protein